MWKQVFRSTLVGYGGDLRAFQKQQQHKSPIRDAIKFITYLLPSPGSGISGTMFMKNVTPHNRVKLFICSVTIAWIFGVTATSFTARVCTIPLSWDVN